MGRGRRLIFILWPSFIVAGLATGVFFTLVDPADLRLLDRELALSRTAVYTLGFFAFWAFAAASSGLTCFFQRSAADINRPGSDGFDASQGAGGGRAVP